MKIENEYVQIRANGKTVTFTNRILDYYLTLFAEANLVTKNIKRRFDLDNLFLKFDAPLEYKDEYDTSDFDGMLTNKTKSHILSNKSGLSITYEYATDENSKIYSTNTELSPRTLPIENFYNRRITAVGFAGAGRWTDGNKMCAILDLSKQNIMFQDGQDFSLIRKDNISTDAIFFTNIGALKSPIHINPFGDSIYVEGIEHGGFITKMPNSIANLYSIGTAPAIGMMTNEHILRDSEVVIEGNTLTFNNFVNHLVTDFVIPENNIVPSEKLYPMIGKQNYIVLKYEIYKIVLTWDSEGNIIQTPTATGKFYYMYFKSTTFGTGKIEIKYERSKK